MQFLAVFDILQLLSRRGLVAAAVTTFLVNGPRGVHKPPSRLQHVYVGSGAEK